MNNSPIIIAGSGRSGTTWVLDAIAGSNRLRTVFEPLHPAGVPEAKAFANKHVRDDADEPDLKLFMDKVFSGKLKGIWPNYRTRPDRLHINNLLKPGSLKHHLGALKERHKKLFVRYLRYRKVRSDHLIIKFIRANLMLGWLSRNYDAKTLLVVRHPGAVAASKMRLGGPDWEPESMLRQYCQDNNPLMKDHLHRFENVHIRALSPVARHAALWCVENVLPLSHAREHGHCVVFYEHLIADSDVEWERVIKSLGLRHIFGEDALSQPSQQVSGEMRGKPFDRGQVSRWMNNFDREQLHEIDRILDIFGVSVYSAFDPMPAKRASP